MMDDQLDLEERVILLQYARIALEACVQGEPLQAIDVGKFSTRLQAPGASFVTLKIDGRLRGCIGAIEASIPLIEDVCVHAAAAATQDYRFPPVQPEELSSIQVEISRLTVPKLLEYACPEDLPVLLRPNVDGVVLSDGKRRATFLPQVWSTLSEVDEFLGQLCRKMGVSEDMWRMKKLKILTYQVEEFQE